MEVCNEMPKIQKLPAQVLNLIAAGEVIQKPWNAVKELMENSLDAGATDIKITVKNGGMKLLQVQDNGSGIESSDLELLCSRYSTSKLRQFDDLKSISTYGFRGEALASISQISHVSVMTKTKSALHGYRAEYEGELMKEPPKPCACNEGTQITAEDLFYNMPVRQKAVKAVGEEMRKIIELVSRYAIRSPHVSFSVKKWGEAVLELKTNGTTGQGNPDACPTRNAIGMIYGASLARDLLRFQYNDAPPALAFKADGYVSPPGQSMKKKTFILFINNRLVNCNELKRAVEGLYASYGPAKSVAPFVYLNMEIEPRNIDVNVHPSKEVVQFLNEQEIIQAIESSLKVILDEGNTSRSFTVKHLPSALSASTSTSIPENSQSGYRGGSSNGTGFRYSIPESGRFADRSRSSSVCGNGGSIEVSGGSGRNGNQKRAAAHTMVRTDGRERKLNEFFMPATVPKSQNVPVSFLDFGNENAGSSASSSNSRASIGMRLRATSYEPRPRVSSKAGHFDGDPENPEDFDEDPENSENTDEGIGNAGNFDGSLGNAGYFDENPENSGRFVGQPGNCGDVGGEPWNAEYLVESPGNSGNYDENTQNFPGNARNLDDDDPGNYDENHRNFDVDNGNIDADDGNFDQGPGSSQTAPVQENEEVSVLYQSDTRKQNWRPVRLGSVLNLQQTIKENCSPRLRPLIARNSLVGCVDAEYFLVQHGTGLYMLNATVLSEELFYQMMIFKFGNFGTLKLSEQCRIIDLLALEMPPSNEKRQQALEYVRLLMSKSKMLWDYFSLKLTDGYLVSIPWLMDKYTPQLEGLAAYIYGLATSVDWSSEETCFETFCRETSKFYAFKKKYCRGDKAGHISHAARVDWRMIVESVLYPAIKSELQPPESFNGTRAVVSVTDVQDLYRVFERC